MTYLVFGYTNGKVADLIGTVGELPEYDDEFLLFEQQDVEFPSYLLNGNTYECHVLSTKAFVTPSPILAYFKAGKRDRDGKLE